MKKIIIKIQNPTVFQTETLPEVKRIAGFINKDAFIKLQSVLSIESNPRQPKQSPVTNEIHESLDNSSEFFHLLTKGILYSALECNAFDRGRFQVSFEENNYAATGILDGGHNTFAIGKYLLSHVLSEKELKTIKNWESYVKKWDKYILDLEDRLDEITDFLIPVEFIVPADQSEGSLFRWSSLISDITHARNNNLQLTDTTKANFQGVYDEIKKHLPEDLNENIEWKTNDGGKIKAQNIVSFLLISLYKIPKDVLRYDLNDTDLIKVYSGKGQCVKLVHNIMEKNGDFERSKFQLNNPVIKTAMQFLPQIIEIYDELYCTIPDAYNKSGGAFGRIESVRIYDPKQYGSKPRYSKSKFKSKFFGKETEYDVPEGFIIPLLVSVCSLMRYNEEEKNLEWIVENPVKYFIQNLSDIMLPLSAYIKAYNYDPQKVGKSVDVYKLIIRELETVLIRQNII